MKKKIVVLMIMLIAITSGASFIAFGLPLGPPPHEGPHFGGPPGPPPGPPPHEGILPDLLHAPPGLIEYLKLTDDQLKKVRLINVGFLNKTRKSRTALMGLHDEKVTMLISGEIDQAKLAACDQQITKLTAEVMSEQLRMSREQLAGLTPEQVNRLADFPLKMKPGHRPEMKKK